MVILRVELRPRPGPHPSHKRRFTTGATTDVVRRRPCATSACPGASRSCTACGCGGARLRRRRPTRTGPMYRHDVRVQHDRIDRCRCASVHPQRRQAADRLRRHGCTSRANIPDPKQTSWVVLRRGRRCPSINNLADSRLKVMGSDPSLEYGQERPVKAFSQGVLRRLDRGASAAEQFGFATSVDLSDGPEGPVESWQRSRRTPVTTRWQTVRLPFGNRRRLIEPGETTHTERSSADDPPQKEV